MSTLYSIVCRYDIVYGNKTQTRKGVNLNYKSLTYRQNVLEPGNASGTPSRMPRLHSQIIDEFVSLGLTACFSHFETCIVLVLIHLSEWPLSSNL
jgi:hypothetical protein